MEYFNWIESVMILFSTFEWETNENLMKRMISFIFIEIVEVTMVVFKKW